MHNNINMHSHISCYAVPIKIVHFELRDNIVEQPSSALMHLHRKEVNIYGNDTR